MTPNFFTISAGNVTALKHDVVADPLPEGAFELIHSRFLLHLVPQCESIVVKFARALKPAGWLLCEVFDHFVAPYPKTDSVRDAVWKTVEPLDEKRPGATQY